MLAIVVRHHDHGDTDCRAVIVAQHFDDAVRILLVAVYDDNANRTRSRCHACLLNVRDFAAPDHGHLAGKLISVLHEGSAILDGDEGLGDRRRALHALALRPRSKTRSDFLVVNTET